MNEIVTFLKSLLSRKFALSIAALITTNMAKIPPKWQAVANLVVVGIYMLANVAEKKTAPTADGGIDAAAVDAQVQAQLDATTTPPPEPTAPASPPDGAAA